MEIEFQNIYKHINQLMIDQTTPPKSREPLSESCLSQLKKKINRLKFLALNAKREGDMKRAKTYFQKYKQTNQLINDSKHSPETKQVEEQPTRGIRNTGEPVHRPLSEVQETDVRPITRPMSKVNVPDVNELLDRLNSLREPPSIVL